MPADEALLGRRAYHASIRFVDEQVAKIDAAMRSADLLESTVWLFTADHGDGQLSQGARARRGEEVWDVQGAAHPKCCVLLRQEVPKAALEGRAQVVA